MTELDFAMEPTDRELVSQTLDGRLEGYDELMQRYQRFVYAIASRYARSSEDALDLSQTVFLKVYRKLRSFRGDSEFRTWLGRIARNEGISWLRANRRHVQGRKPLSEAAELPEGSPGPELTAVNRESRERILGGLAALSHRYRTALILRYFHELSVREVASVLECSEGTAKNVLFRGVRRLREQVSAG